MNGKITIGGNGDETIQFVHANAYTPRCYTQLLTPLAKDYKIEAYELRPLWPNQSPTQLKKWSLLANDLIAMMDRDGQKDVIGMGHSLGAVVTWLASIRRPDLFKRVVMIDPVILPKSWVLSSMLMPYSLMVKVHPLVKIASRRRDTWSSRPEMKEYFLKKKIFQRWDPAALDDFVNHGTRDCDAGVRLAYSPAWESRVYSTPPYLWSKLTKSPVPTHIIRAEYSDVLISSSWQSIQRKAKNTTFYQMDGVGHLLPFEKPKELSSHIRSVLK